MTILAERLGLKDRARSAKVRAQVQEKARHAGHALHNGVSTAGSRVQVLVPQLARTATNRFHTSSGFGTRVGSGLGAVGSRVLHVGRSKRGRGILIAGIGTAWAARAMRRRRKKRSR